jgi:hypothetical protein
MVINTGHVPCVLLISPNGFIPSVLNANLMFLFSSLNSLCLESKVLHCRASEGCQSFPSDFSGDLRAKSLVQRSLGSRTIKGPPLASTTSPM